MYLQKYWTADLFGALTKSQKRMDVEALLRARWWWRWSQPSCTSDPGRTL